MIEAIKLKLKWKFNDFKHLLGIKFNPQQQSGKIVTLCFHGICKDDEPYINGRFIHFSKCLALFQEIKTHFNVISIQDLLAKKLSSSKLNVLITFDDGYYNNKIYLPQLIQKVDLPITIFITTKATYLWTDLLDVLSKNKSAILEVHQLLKLQKTFSNSQLKKHIISLEPKEIETITEQLYLLVKNQNPTKNENWWRLMNDQELKEINKESQITLANHGGNHYNLTTLSNELFSEEIKRNEERVTDVNSNYAKVLAFPYGIYDETIVEQLNSRDYIAMFTTDDISDKQNNLYGRMVINPFISINNQLIAIANGKY